MPKNKKIIFIEDDEVTVRMYQMEFEKAGLRLICAPTGQAGFALVKKQLPALIVLDLKLPDIDGFTILKKLKTDPLTKNIPVIVFTNLQKIGNEKRVRRLGAVDFVMKTKVLPKEFVEIVKKYLN